MSARTPGSCKHENARCDTCDEYIPTQKRTPFNRDTFYCIVCAGVTDGIHTYCATCDGERDSAIDTLCDVSNELSELRTQRDALAEALLPMTRGACLQQINGDHCICYVCSARAALAKVTK